MNAACQRTKEEVKDEEDDEAEPEAEIPEEDEPGEEGPGLDVEETDGTAAISNLLTDFQHKFEAALRQPNRGLLVKDLMVMFDNSTIYGRRAGIHKGLMVTATWISNSVPPP